MSKEIGHISKLRRLKKEGAIALSVNDPSVFEFPKGKHKEPVYIYITEMRVYGIDNDKRLIISIPGKGSAVVDTTDIRIDRLFMAGLSVKASKLLKNELDKLYSKEV